MEEWEFYIYIYMCVCLMVIHGFSFLVGLLNQQSGLCLVIVYFLTGKSTRNGGSKKVIKPLIYHLGWFQTHINGDFGDAL